MRGVTSLVIAHRLSTVKNCDSIIFLNNGEIVE
jgi:ABC-type multidrug transport system fused ATPase/permease subunit